MAKKSSARQRAIRRRNIFLACCCVALAAVIALLVFLTGKVIDVIGGGKDSSKGEASSQSSSESAVNTGPQYVQRGSYTLDANYTDLLLVNSENPLPDDYDYEAELITMEDQYRQQGYDLKQLNATVYPYLQAMCEAAWAENIPLKVCSPYRSYSIQQTLFQRQVNKQIEKGYTGAEAENRAASIVARPGTSEHHTGLAVDFICSNDSFEGMPAFTWLQQHAAEYGFILRYPKDKTEITGVIYESWHYRFVGINEAQKIKESGLCLEEYLEQQKQPKEK